MAEKSRVFKKGEIIIIQGEKSPNVYYMTSGSVEVLSAAEEYTGLDAKIVLEHSSRVCLISESTFLAGVTGRTVRAVTDCEMQVFSNEGGFIRFATEDPARAVTMILHLFRRVEMSCADLAKFNKLFQNISIVGDNLALMSKVASAGELPERLNTKAENLNEIFAKANVALPKILDHQFLLTDRSGTLKKKYAVPGESIDNIFDRELYNFLKRFAKIDRNIFVHCIKADPEIAVFIYNKIVSCFTKVFDKMSMIYDAIDDEMEMLYGAEDSWARYLAEYGAFKDWEHSGRVSPDFSKNFASLSAKIYSMYSDFSGRDITQKFPGLSKLKEYFTKAPPKIEKPAGLAAAASSGDSSNISRLYVNSMQQILEFAVMPNDFCAQLTKMINEFIRHQNPFSPDEEPRKLRRQITKQYWLLYSQVYIRSLKETKIPAPVRMMIHFGFLDERLVEPDQIEVLHSLSRLNQNAEIPAMFEYEFLQKINNLEEPPSLNEVGLTFEKQMREESERSGKKGDVDDPLRKVDYEIQNRVQSTVGICSGSRSTAFPIMTSHLLRGNPESFYISKQKISDTLKELLALDCSAFYRETVTKLNEPVIFEEEIFPYFIILPSFGTKTMMWQELVGTNKRSRARIVVPVFFMGDLKRSLAHSIASFRWELNRSLQGAMWADPVEGGLTGAYYDYVQFFRKNSKLSPEAKEKLHERIKGVRNNMKELFCEDYIMWLLYECEGTMKLNTVVRDMFYRFIPFKKEIRDRLETMPAFVELANKFKNVRTRKIREYENKFRKYRDANGVLPPTLQKFMDYLKM